MTGCLLPLRMRGSALKGKNLVLWLMGEGGGGSKFFLLDIDTF